MIESKIVEMIWWHLVAARRDATLGELLAMLTGLFHSHSMFLTKW